MATNPMQRKARNSILLGIVIGLLVMGVVAGLLFMQLMKLQKEMQQAEAATKTAYVLTADIKSGDKIQVSALAKKQVLQDVIPTDYITTADITENTVAKIDLKKGSVLSKALIQEADEKITADLRQQEYNTIILPQQLEIGDYIDIRLRLANGQDYIVVSKKQVQNMTEDTVWLNMYEGDTLAMSNAIVEAYIMKGAKLYATTYVEPGNQQTASLTYKPSYEVASLMESDPNITMEAKKVLVDRYNNEAVTARRNSDINGEINKYAEEAKENLESKVEQEITSSKEARKQYLDSLNAGVQ